MAPGRGGRGGARGGRGGGAFNPARGTVSIGGVELQWDISGLDIQRVPAERFPKAPPPQAPPPTDEENNTVKHSLAVRDMIHEGSFYTILGDGMKSGLKRKANEPVHTEESLFNPFTDNQTFTSKYLKVRRRIPNLNTRPYVTDLFPSELRSIIAAPSAPTKNGNGVEEGPPRKKRRTLQISKRDGASFIDRFIKDEEQRAKTMEERDDNDEEEEVVNAEEDDDGDDDKPDAINEDDNWSAASTDSEESDDDYNAEQYFDNGEDDDLDDGDPDENTY